ncbi:MAG: UDP-N-acetylglucosamine 2-epimerase (non-hydrolyzing) [Gammaproteobacteria bacterium CG11_big_fil_rev_8_21_14_0_20_46_22]|nr:MAG: UDP-N-acetylglucosamine 2-epimerase (non-hydrolyzing) [Gammaproteobacteria bacterium CG12_big_fil_rev_8_21_14_0_65_46_12]PIR12140.1 MAG: UDP-N-acetylglucosamine 2-epimerase (non-hydrolyzing) [Gammaproteobacteria bacterium CG11_big_fil_rev_8_21_14_0_20_46_22]
MKVLTVMGTRPEVIKMAPVIKALESSDHFKSLVCVTSQHRQMQDQMMSLFGLKADFDLGLMKPNQTLTDVTVGVLQGLQALFREHRFDWVLVQGDTTTSMAASMAAFYAGIPVAHVEAGLRTYDLQRPFPEELNRQLTARMAAKHFAPTDCAKQNLLSEGVSAETIFVTGNTVIDALLYMREKIRAGEVQISLPESIQSIVDTQTPYVLITGHRRESFGEGFLNICQAIQRLAKQYSDWQFIYPVHLNPNVQAPVNEHLNGLANVHLIAPQEYAPFIYLMDHCRVVLTDSGGVQEEAPSLGKPVLVMREKTERPEGVEAGTAKLVGNRSDDIIAAVSGLIDDSAAYDAMAKAVNPYGDGQAAWRIVEWL